MDSDPVGALRRERSELLTYCRDLSDADLQTQSAADGWRVQDTGLRAARPAWLDRPISITLSGPGGGCWVMRPGATIHLGSPAGTAAQIDSLAVEFPEWATQRTSWRDRTVSIAGDTDYGARFLDAVNVV